MLISDAHRFTPLFIGTLLNTLLLGVSLYFIFEHPLLTVLVCSGHFDAGEEDAY